MRTFLNRQPRVFLLAAALRHELIVDSDESNHRLKLLHENVRKYGTVFNTVAPGTQLSGCLARKVTA